MSHAKENILTSVKSEIAERKAKKERVDRAESQAKRNLGPFGYVGNYLEKLNEDEMYEWTVSERFALRDQIEEKLRPALVAKLTSQDMSDEEVHRFIRQYVRHRLDELYE